MQCLALLRGVMPTGPNRIPKMSELIEILEASDEALADQIHQSIFQQIGANLSVVIKKKADLD
ncbi:hypothetical protein FOA32_000587 [Streptococcus sinensis]|nr:hypothetical protein [Streptococcus sinensis]